MKNTHSNNESAAASQTGRAAVRRRDWNTVVQCAEHLLRIEPENAEGHFLSGLGFKAQRELKKAIAAFERALELDARRYDAAVELANLYSSARRNADAAQLLGSYEEALSNSPLYLDLAGTVYSEIGMPQKSWPLFKKATSLQPEIDVFQANLATCAVFLGKIDQAREIYRGLLAKNPGHRGNHYQLSRLSKARDYQHIEQMKAIVSSGPSNPGQDIPIYYALGKELEDLEQWDEAFAYYHKAGQAVNSVAAYDIEKDLALIDNIIDTCDSAWLSNSADDTPPATGRKTPVFIAGLPRTGSTLVERIISSHSQVESLGETLFMQMVLRRESGVSTLDSMNAQIIAALAGKDMGVVAQGYLDAVAYRLGTAPMFIEKLPLNFLYLGYIARAFPSSPLIYVQRNPMDTCFSMFKQVFTWAYKFSYSLENLGRYYIAHDRLLRHWRQVLGDRLVEVCYEDLVKEPESQTRHLLDRMGLEFEMNCLNFHQNESPSTTASSVQVREKFRDSSVGRWKRFDSQLKALRAQLEEAGIPVE